MASSTPSPRNGAGKRVSSNSYLTALIDGKEVESRTHSGGIIKSRDSGLKVATNVMTTSGSGGDDDSFPGTGPSSAVSGGGGGARSHRTSSAGGSGGGQSSGDDSQSSPPPPPPPISERKSADAALLAPALAAAAAAAPIDGSGSEMDAATAEQMIAAIRRFSTNAVRGHTVTTAAAAAAAGGGIPPLSATARRASTEAQTQTAAAAAAATTAAAAAAASTTAGGQSVYGRGWLYRRAMADDDASAAAMAAGLTADTSIWLPRYCVLRGHPPLLAEFLTANEDTIHADDYDVERYLLNAASGSVIDDAKYQRANCFEIHTSTTEPPLVYSASSNDERRTWLLALAAVRLDPSSVALSQKMLSRPPAAAAAGSGSPTAATAAAAAASDGQRTRLQLRARRGSDNGKPMSPHAISAAAAANQTAPSGGSGPSGIASAIAVSTAKRSSLSALPTNSGPAPSPILTGASAPHNTNANSLLNSMSPLMQPTAWASPQSASPLVSPRSGGSGNSGGGGGGFGGSASPNDVSPTLLTTTISSRPAAAHVHDAPHSAPHTSNSKKKIAQLMGIVPDSAATTASAAAAPRSAAALAAAAGGYSLERMTGNSAATAALPRSKTLDSAAAAAAHAKKMAQFFGSAPPATLPGAHPAPSAIAAGGSVQAAIPIVSHAGGEHRRSATVGHTKKKQQFFGTETVPTKPEPTSSAAAANHKTNAPASGSGSSGTLSIEIRRTDTVNKDKKPFTVYYITVRNGRLEWECPKRYSEFDELHKSLCSKYDGGSTRLNKILTFPSKRYSKTMKPAVIEERRVQFQAYLQKIITIPDIANSILFLSFLGLIRKHDIQSVESLTGVSRLELGADAALAYADVGDVILFRTPHTLPQLQRLVLHSKWDHVALVIRIPILSSSVGSLMLLEAVKSGVCVYPLPIRLEQSLKDRQKIVIRKLRWTVTVRQLQRLEAFIDHCLGQSYSLKGLLLGSGGSGAAAGTKRDAEASAAGDAALAQNKESYFCSELVACAYRAMVLLPGDFSSETDLQLIGATLDKEVLIKLNGPNLAVASAVPTQQQQQQAAIVSTTPHSTKSGGATPPPAGSTPFLFNDQKHATRTPAVSAAGLTAAGTPTAAGAAAAAAPAADSGRISPTTTGAVLDTDDLPVYNRARATDDPARKLKRTSSDLVDMQALNEAALKGVSTPTASTAVTRTPSGEGLAIPSIDRNRSSSNSQSRSQASDSDTLPVPGADGGLRRDRSRSGSGSRTTPPPPPPPAGGLTINAKRRSGSSIPVTTAEDESAATTPHSRSTSDATAVSGAAAAASGGVSAAIAAPRKTPQRTGQRKNLADIFGTSFDANKSIAPLRGGSKSAAAAAAAATAAASTTASASSDVKLSPATLASAPATRLTISDTFSLRDRAAHTTGSAAREHIDIPEDSPVPPPPPAAGASPGSSSDAFSFGPSVLAAIPLPLSVLTGGVDAAAITKESIRIGHQRAASGSGSGISSKK